MPHPPVSRRIKGIKSNISAGTIKNIATKYYNNLIPVFSERFSLFSQHISVNEYIAEEKLPRK